VRPEIVHQYGVPEFIHSDNGKQFVSKIFGELMTRWGIAVNIPNNLISGAQKIGSPS